MSHFHLILNGIKRSNWRQIPTAYPQEQGKVEAYNKIVIAKFLQVEELIDEDGAKKYSYAIKENDRSSSLFM